MGLFRKIFGKKKSAVDELVEELEDLTKENLTKENLDKSLDGLRDLQGLLSQGGRPSAAIPPQSMPHSPGWRDLHGAAGKLSAGFASCTANYMAQAGQLGRFSSAAGSAQKISKSTRINVGDVFLGAPITQEELDLMEASDGNNIKVGLGSLDIAENLRSVRIMLKIKKEQEANKSITDLIQEGIACFNGPTSKKV